MKEATIIKKNLTVWYFTGLHINTKNRCMYVLGWVTGKERGITQIFYINQGPVVQSILSLMCLLSFHHVKSYEFNPTCDLWIMNLKQYIDIFKPTLNFNKHKKYRLSQISVARYKQGMIVLAVLVSRQKTCSHNFHKYLETG